MLELVELECGHLLCDAGQGLHCHFVSHFDGEGIEKWCREPGIIQVVGAGVEEVVDEGV